MTVTRRVFVSGAMAAPFLAQLGGAAPATASAPLDTTFSLLDGLGEIRLTELALSRLAAEEIEVEAVAPATALMGADGTTVVGVTLPPEYATGTVNPLGQPAKGSARVSGGVALQNSKARMEITSIRGSMPEGRISAFLKVDDEWIGEQPLYAADPSAVRLSVQPGAPGQPTTLKGSGIPITPTQEGVDAFTEAFGVALFAVTDRVFTASGTGRAWPVPTLPV
ncbi:hypothetical protein [Actinokineospora spheciospongiae]|uniref:hypothetical protein n=1 Tax=Actinokineospora spheciospongiae TaxID=909613 RepID=UPI000D9EFEAF|nr:hypothetical protein [Actinokineospora spheciospongiae]PWW63394.1 hypothetical protein DFQ13_104384 [Actinokineospora spheciospongiae]